jgi:NarL family two-component system sensor histidine kinase LiaS
MMSTSSTSQVQQTDFSVLQEGQPSELASSIHRAIEQERHRIAEELHDSVAQDIALALHKLEYIQHLLEQSQLYQAFQEVTHAARILENGLDDLRNSIDGLLPRQFDKQPIFSALIMLMQEFQQDHPELRFDCRLEPSDLMAHIPSWLEMPVFRFVQQAFNNIWQHASAHYVVLSLVLTMEMLVVEVVDDGGGFSLEYEGGRPDCSANNETTAQQGLRIMRERVEHVGGTWEIKSQIGVGTSVHASFPLRRQA